MSSRTAGASAIAVVTSLFAIQAALGAIHRILLFSYERLTHVLEAFLLSEAEQGVLW